MKHIINCGGFEELPTEDEVEVANILITFPKILLKSELINRYSFIWGVKKKRSVLNSSASPSTLPLTERRVSEDVTEKVTAVDADKSPSTPLSFLPSGSGSDCVADKHKSKTSSSGKKRKATNDLVESYNRMHHEREILLKETKAMKTLHQELCSTNRELKAIIQKVNYTRNMEDFHKWSKSMKIFDHQSYPQITMFAPPTQQQQQHCQQFVALSCSGNSHSGGGFGMFNQVDPRVKILHGEGYDFMGCSQPLDQSNYLMMDNDLRMRTAAAARQRRIMRRKENKNASLALKLSRGSR